MSSLSLHQDTPEWLEFRKTKIGASDAPCIMGVGFYTPYQLWRYKLDMDEQYVNAAMQKGKEFEPRILCEYETMTGRSTVPTVLIHQDYRWMMASLDGYNAKDDIAVEVKYASQENHKIAQQGQVPERYYPQIQHQLAVTGHETMDYFSFSAFDESTCLVEVERDEEYIKILVEKELKFYDCLQSLVEPELENGDYVSREDEAWTAKAKEYLDASEKYEKYRIQKEECRQDLIKLSAGNSSTGGGIRLCQFIRKGNVNYSKIPELDNVDLDRFRKPSSFQWRIDCCR